VERKSNQVRLFAPNDAQTCGGGEEYMPITLSMNQAAAHVEQGSPEWMQARCGDITASRIKDVTARKKDGSPTAERERYLIELVCERLTGDAADHYVSKDMEWGTLYENTARQAYMTQTGLKVRQVGFIAHPTMPYSGASPDGLLAGKEGGLEIKCPRIETHIKWMRAKVVPLEHRDQMYWNMECTERQWWDFLSFHPKLPIEVRGFIVRLDRDEKRIATIREEVKKFDEEIQAVLKELGLPSYWKKEPTADEMRAALMNDMTEVMP
jgi:exodeoxyribonuclease (lambda-induced)